MSEKLLMELLAIPPGCQKTTAKWLAMAGHPQEWNWESEKITTSFPPARE